jgi:hypothetical protein
VLSHGLHQGLAQGIGEPHQPFATSTAVAARLFTTGFTSILDLGRFSNATGQPVFPAGTTIPDLGSAGSIFRINGAGTTQLRPAPFAGRGALWVPTNNVQRIQNFSGGYTVGIGVSVVASAMTQFGPKPAGTRAVFGQSDVGSGPIGRYQLLMTASGFPQISNVDSAGTFYATTLMTDHSGEWHGWTFFLDRTLAQTGIVTARGLAQVSIAGAAGLAFTTSGAGNNSLFITRSLHANAMEAAWTQFMIANGVLPLSPQQFNYNLWRGTVGVA